MHSLFINIIEELYSIEEEKNYDCILILFLLYICYVSFI